MTRDDVIDVLSAVAAGDNRTTGTTDVDLWCAVIGEHPRDLAIRAVIEHRRECPGVWLEPGHVYQRVRAMLRDRLERESDAEREATTSGDRQSRRRARRCTQRSDKHPRR